MKLLEDLIKSIKEKSKQVRFILCPFRIEYFVDTVDIIINTLLDEVHRLEDIISRDRFNKFKTSSEASKLFPSPDNLQNSGNDDASSPTRTDEASSPDTALLSDEEIKERIRLSSARKASPGTGRKRGRRPLPNTFPEHHFYIDCPEEICSCPHCGGRLVPYEESVSRKLTRHPAYYTIDCYHRIRRICPHCSHGVEHPDGGSMVSILAPDIFLIPGGNADPGLIAHCAMLKFGYAVPLNRQEAMFADEGIQLSRGTTDAWLLNCADRMGTNWLNLFLEKAVRGSALNMDETPVKVHNEPGKADTQESFMWVISYDCAYSKSHVRYYYYGSRSGTIPKILLDGFIGFLQTDGYTGYNPVTRGNGNIMPVGCLAHIRRKFVDILKAAGDKRTKVPKDSTTCIILDKINTIFRMENDFRENNFNECKILEQRNLKIRPILDELHEILIRTKDEATSLLSKAVNYALGQWDRLLNYLLHPALAPDNNQAERTVKPFVIGRKNWLFCETPRGARASAMYYTMIETARANGLNAEVYLHFVLRMFTRYQASARLEELLPWNTSNERMLNALEDDIRSLTMIPTA